jgi:hypothetical protein
MAWFQFNPLHWGQVKQQINIADPDTDEGQVKSANKGATVKKVTRSGRAGGVGGSSSKGTVGGSK